MSDYARLAEEFVWFWDDVSKAEKFDTNAGDSAVSIILWSWAEHVESLRRTQNVRNGPSQVAEGRGKRG